MTDIRLQPGWLESDVERARLRLASWGHKEFKDQYEQTWEPRTSLLPPDAVLGPKVLVCGGRTYKNRRRVWAVLDEMHARCPITLVIHGAARGADRLAHWWATVRDIPMLAETADWVGMGAGAGPRRNRQMLATGRPDVVVAFPGDRGTRDMLQISKICGYDRIDLRYEVYGWVGSP